MLGQRQRHGLCEVPALVVGIPRVDNNIVPVGIEAHQLRQSGTIEVCAWCSHVIDEGIVLQGLTAVEGQHEAYSLLFASLSDGRYLRGRSRAEEDIQLLQLGQQSLYLIRCRPAIPSINVEIDATLAHAVCSH